MDKIVVTIAREFGSGGKTIGKMLAKELGIKYYDRSIIKIVSDKTGISEKLFNQLDENVKKPGIFRKEYSDEISPPESSEFLSNENLFKMQSQIVKEIAENESCVIVGRCADFVLKDMKDVVKVFIYANDDFCLEQTKLAFGIGDKEAKNSIATINKTRENFYKRYTGNDWRCAKNYDLCLNSSDLGFNKCVEIIKKYIEIR